jgi:hypothetical protein
LLLQYSITTVSQATTPIFLKVRKGVLDWELHLWHQEPTFPKKSNIFILGVTGVKTDINNNVFTNFVFWCIDYTYEQIENYQVEYHQTISLIDERV